MPLRSSFFENFLLRATRREDLNDPFELQPSTHAWAHYYSQVGNTRIRSIDEMIEIIEKTDFLKEQEEQFPMFNNTGIMSFSKSEDNILMWSHYADCHKGMKLGFDASHEFFCNSKPYDSYTGRLHQIEYTTNRPNNIVDNPQELFTTKAIDWKYENEYRLILDISCSDVSYKGGVSDDNIYEFDCFNYLFEENLFFMFRIPKEAVISVTFGSKSDKNEISKITSKIRGDKDLKHVEINQVSLSKSNYSTRIVKL